MIMMSSRRERSLINHSTAQPCPTRQSAGLLALEAPKRFRWTATRRSSQWGSQPKCDSRICLSRDLFGSPPFQFLKPQPSKDVGPSDCHGRGLRQPQNAKNKAPEHYQGFLKRRQRRVYLLLMMVMSSSTHTAKHIPLTTPSRPVPRSHPLLRSFNHNRVYITT